MNERQFLNAILESVVPGVTSHAVGAHLECGPGDDAAVLKVGSETLVLTTDSCVEGRHFSFDYFTPRQVGAKAVEAACSDVIAMGAHPACILWTLHVAEGRDTGWYQELSAGVGGACARLKAPLAGGNISRASDRVELVVSAIGVMPKGRSPRLRSGARPGDAVVVSGTLGAARAGFELLSQNSAGFEALKRAHLEPRARLDLVDKVGAHVHALIDISDGLASELHYLSEASGAAFLIDPQRIPIHPELTRYLAGRDVPAWRYAIESGEEYQVLGTVPMAQVERMPVTVIGSVAEVSELTPQGVWVRGGEGPPQPLPRLGFDHLA